MKQSSLGWAVAACLVVGCGKGNTSGGGTNSTSGNPVTAPVDYLGAVAQGQQKAVKTVDVASLTQAVNLFQVSEGRLPKDLNELVSSGYIGRIPDAPYGQKIVYNPTNGQVKVVPLNQAGQ
jgi:hypothetical protein